MSTQQTPSPSSDLLRPDAESLKSRPKVVRNVTAFEQNGVNLFSFVLTGEHLVALGAIEPFDADGGEGVNRAYDEVHATEIAEALLDPELLWFEPFFGNLAGNWIYDADKRVLRLDPADFISIDDGQHRLIALRLVSDEVRRQMSFNITAVRNLPFERRVKIFGMQNKRKPFDRRLMLAHSFRTSTWDNPLDEQAYKIVQALNGDSDSVLKGKIAVYEPQSVPGTGKKNDVGLIDGKGVFRAVRGAINRASPLLFKLTPARQLAVIKDLLLAASEVWPSAWGSSAHILLTARGINAVLSLPSRSNSFRVAVGSEPGPGPLRLALSDAKSFNWTKTKGNNLSSAVIVKKLDEAIGRGHARRVGG